MAMALGFGGKVRGGELDHLAGAHKQHATLPRSSNSWPARRTAAAAMLMECAPISVEVRTSLATANERWNSWFSVVPRAPAFGCAHGVFHLAQDLRLAQHHGVQPAGHAEGVAGGMAVLQTVGVRAQRVGRNAAELASQPSVGSSSGVHRRNRFRCGCRWKRWPLRACGQRLAQAHAGGGDLVHGERKPAAHVQRRGGVVDA
jgi:hypothetical protein